MSDSLKIINQGSITSPKGFSAGASFAGINKHSPYKLDTAILYSSAPCTTRAIYTTNKVKAAPVLLCQKRLPSPCIRALVVNSGIANACTGESGLLDAYKLTEIVSTKFDLKPDEVLSMSTGVIGKRIPVNTVEKTLLDIKLDDNGGHLFARAIMTTDTRPKEIAVKVESSAGSYTIAGAAKGAGMIAPDMATTLCFITTDASIEDDALKSSLANAGCNSFNMITVDGDTSTNDTLMVMANGMAGNRVIKKGSMDYRLFKEALMRACVFLAKCVASDGEGATRLITVSVSGAFNLKDARMAAKTIAGSNLVKSAIHGADPNWGRIISAAGRSRARMDENITSLKIGGIPLWKNGNILEFDLNRVRSAMMQSEVTIELDLNIGNSMATAWGCDLSEEYVTINSEYTT